MFYHFPEWGLLFPWNRPQIEGINGFYCLFRKTHTKWGERSCPNSETVEVVLNPGPFDRKVRCSTTGGFEPLFPRPKVRRSTTRPPRPIYAATNKENNDSVTVTEIHTNTSDYLDGCMNNTNWTHCNKQGEQRHCDSHRDSHEHL